MLGLFRARAAPRERAEDAAPRVSCIMPTTDRRSFVARAIDNFRRQDYPNKQLVIVDDGQASVGDLAAGADDIRYVALRSKASVGEKRNIAVAESDGRFIAHWDDDDWYDQRRLSYQLAPLLSGTADMTALRMSYLYDLLGDSLWLVDRDVYERMFFLGIHTGSVAYPRRLWGSAVSFPSIYLGEDMDFIRDNVQLGARVLRLPNDVLFAQVGHADAGEDLPLLEELARRWGGANRPQRPVCIYVRHSTNTWRFACGEHLRRRAWHRIAPENLLPTGDLAAYRAIAASVRSASPPARAGDGPRPVEVAAGRRSMSRVIAAYTQASVVSASSS
jgi:glycosyltransferase involved in cell wall biosynthesis